MDLQKITSIEKLESLGFQQIQARDIASANLQAIVNRINELTNQPKDEKGSIEK